MNDMSGRPGTARFGQYADEHTTKTDGQGDSDIKLQGDGPFTEIHFMYDPSQVSRPMGTTLGGVPGKYFDRENRGYDAPANHDGFFGGDAHLVNLDERKVLDNWIMATKTECADEQFTNSGSMERTA